MSRKILSISVIAAAFALAPLASVSAADLAVEEDTGIDISIFEDVPEVETEDTIIGIFDDDIDLGFKSPFKS